MKGGKGSREKGNRFERYVVKYAMEQGLPARRIPLSGAVQGFANDVEISDFRFECKHFHKPISGKLEAILEKCLLSGGIGVIVRADRGEPRIYLPLSFLLELLKNRSKD